MKLHRQTAGSAISALQTVDMDNKKIITVPSATKYGVVVMRGGYNYDSISIRRPFDCLSQVIKVTVT